VPVVFGVTALLVLIAAGAIYLVNSVPSTIKKSTVMPVSEPAPAAPVLLPHLGEKQATDVAPAASTPSIAPIADHPPAMTTPAIVSIVPNHPQLSKPTLVTTPEVKSNGMQVAIDATLDEGENCMTRKKYDCAISSANTVLRLDANNTRGLDMKRKAKEAQDKAMSQIDIQ
jgi:hypothetical protein